MSATARSILQHRAWTLLALLVVSLGTLRTAHADLATIERAQAAYDRGIELVSTKPAEAKAAFAESAALLQGLVDAGADTSDLHYNLGNAYVQAGDYGRGIARYLRARQLTPFAPHVLANLASARTDAGVGAGAGSGAGFGAGFSAGSGLGASIGGGGELSDGSQYAWWRLISEPTRRTLAIVAWILAWSLVAVPLLRPTMKGAGTGAGKGAGTGAGPRVLRTCRTIAFIVAIFAGLSVGADRWLAATRHLAVITASDVVLRKGNGEGFAPQIAEKLTPGIECMVLEERPGWLRVRLGDGTEGWVREDAIVRV
jgi:hypothetical protein